MSRIGSGRYGSSKQDCGSNAQDIAFYTVGDTRPFGENLGFPPTSDVYRAAAERLAPSAAHGANTIQEAQQALEACGDGSLRAAYFIGHGYERDEGGYFFHGHPDSDPTVWFNHSPSPTGFSEILCAPQQGDPVDHNTPFVNMLARKLRRNDCCWIHFMSCYTARGTLLGFIENILDQTHIGKISGTRHFHGINIDGTSHEINYYMTTAENPENPYLPGQEIIRSTNNRDLRHLEIILDIGLSVSDTNCMDYVHVPFEP